MNLFKNVFKLFNFWELISLCCETNKIFINSFNWLWLKFYDWNPAPRVIAARLTSAGFPVAQLICALMFVRASSLVPFKFPFQTVGIPGAVLPPVLPGILHECLLMKLNQLKQLFHFVFIVLVLGQPQPLRLRLGLVVRLVLHLGSVWMGHPWPPSTTATATNTTAAAAAVSQRFFLGWPFWRRPLLGQPFWGSLCSVRAPVRAAPIRNRAVFHWCWSGCGHGCRVPYSFNDVLCLVQR